MAKWLISERRTTIYVFAVDADTKKEAIRKFNEEAGAEFVEEHEDVGFQDTVIISVEEVQNG